MEVNLDLPDLRDGCIGCRNCGGTRGGVAVGAFVGGIEVGRGEVAVGAVVAGVAVGFSIGVDAGGTTSSSSLITVTYTSSDKLSCPFPIDFTSIR